MARYYPTNNLGQKKQKGLAMKFAAFVLKEAETVGKAKALML
jgi:hypothetical protein